MDDRPNPQVPEDLSRMTPQQAWNAALDAAEEIAAWEAFWNDGQGSDFAHLRVTTEQGGQA